MNVAVPALVAALAVTALSLPTRAAPRGRAKPEPEPEPKPKPKPKPKPTPTPKPKPGTFRYVEVLHGTDNPNEPLPMVIAFHAMGSRPEGYRGMLQGLGKYRLIAPEGELGKEGGPRYWWHLGPTAARKSSAAEAKAAAEWAGVADRMASFIAKITHDKPTIGKPIVTGSSQGGQMALLMASRHPEAVRGAVAVASYVLPPLQTPSMAPTTMIHGTGDTTVPYDISAEYAERMKAKGAPLTFQSFPSGGHAVTGQMSHAWRQALAKRLTS